MGVKGNQYTPEGDINLTETNNEVLKESYMNEGERILAVSSHIHDSGF